MPFKMEVIQIDKLYDLAALERIIENTLNETAAAAKVDFEVTQQTWSNKHAFVIRKKKNIREIFTDSEIYGYVNDGTRPHKIRTKTASTLAFQANYRAKTVVRRIGSRQGGSSGPTVFAREVNHPGTDGRHFDEEIAVKWGKELPVQMQRAIDSEV